MHLDIGARDPRIRSFVNPARVIWTTADGVADPANLLTDDDNVCTLTNKTGADAPGIVLDFGRELHGGIRLDAPTTGDGKSVRVRIRFGESVSEAMGSPNNDHTIHDQETLIPWMGHVEIGSTAFRFVRVDVVAPGAVLMLRTVRAVFLRRDLDYLGSFECNDERLNRIWQTGAYTVHLCMQDLVWDGAKRDRLAWIGDLHPEAMVISTVFGGLQIVPETLDYVRDHTPLPGWMNTISSYSLWWILIQRDWYRYHGDMAYLTQQGDYLAGLLEQVESRLDECGCEHLEPMRFLEWPTSEDPTAIDAGLQALVTVALRAGADLCAILGRSEDAHKAADAHTRAASCVRPLSASKQANALLALAGMADPQAVNDGVLAVRPDRDLSTFYGYYILQARAMAGDFGGCLNLIRSYWGGMLDLGATTFWEGFDLDWTANAAGIDEIVPPGKADIHADFGNWCYKGLRHSLCHGWASGPTAWLSEHVLGITPAEPGFRKVRIAPRLGGLEWARGTFPTPHGVIRVEHHTSADGTVKTAVEAPQGVEVMCEH